MSGYWKPAVTDIRKHLGSTVGLGKCALKPSHNGLSTVGPLSVDRAAEPPMRGATDDPQTRTGTPVYR